MYSYNPYFEKYLAHYGTPKHSGRYPYGSGKRPYQHGSVFVSGSVKTGFEDSGYYRKNLSKDVQNELNTYMKKGKKINVGDAPGIDSQVQDYLKKSKYDNVTVYTGYDTPRYIANKKWEVKKIDGAGYEPGTPEFNRQKDIAMTNDSESGLAVILENGGAGATRNNIQRLLDQNKDVKVYELRSDLSDSFINVADQFKVKVKNI